MLASLLLPCDDRNMREVRDWRDEAACLKEEPELFFPKGNTGPAKWQIEEAKRVCGGCAVRLTCLDWALEKRMEHGIWGGLSEDERRALKRRKNRSVLE